MASVPSPTCFCVFIWDCSIIMFLAILIFLLLVNPVFAIGPTSGNLVAMAIIVLMSVFLIPNRKLFSTELFSLLFAGLTPLLYYSFVSLNSISENYLDFIFIPASIFISFVVVEIFASVYGEEAYEKIMKLLVCSVVVWSLTLILENASQTFKDILSLLFYRSDLAADHLIKIRSAGFHPTGGDGASLNLMLLATLSFLYLTEFMKKRIVVGLVFLSLAIFGAILSGRSGAFVAVSTIIVIALYLRNKGAYIFSLVSAASVLAIIMFANIIDLGYLGSNLGWESPIVRLLRVFSFGPYHSDILNVLLDRMLIFPEHELELLFGSGELSRHVVAGAHIVESDLGIVRIVNGIGILGWSLVYGILLTPLAKAFRSSRDDPNNIKVLILAASIFIFFSDFKIIYSLTRLPWLIVFILYFLWSKAENKVGY